MFASKTLREHLVRGVIGLSLFALALALSDESLLYPLVLLPVALVALRGCPMCWLMGLGETIVAKLSGRSSDGACVDGRCAVTRRPKPSLARMFEDLLGGP